MDLVQDHEGSPTLNRSHYSILGAVTLLLQDPSAMLETLVGCLGWEDALEKGIATQSSILVWRFHGQKSRVGYSSWGHRELDTTE